MKRATKRALSDTIKLSVLAAFVGLALGCAFALTYSAGELHGAVTEYNFWKEICK